MENGEGLLGHPSSTSSGVALPAGDNKFYIFTLADVGKENGLCYSIVDINLNGGLGAITEKNILLKGSVTEKLTAVRQRNNKDIWVIAHDVDNANFWLI